jgi:hypothetical protein
MLFRNLPSAIGIMSYTCFTRAGVFASWSNSLSFQSNLVYTSCASASLPAVPNVASAATLAVPVLTNHLRSILIVPFRSEASLYLLGLPSSAAVSSHASAHLSGNLRMNVGLANLTPHLATDNESVIADRS